MTQEKIENLIREPHFQKIIHETDFYFLKGQQALNNWLKQDVTEQMREDLIRISSDYTQFSEIAVISPEIEKVKDQLFEIIAYCDNRAKDKSRYNQYNDDRVLADASVRMNNWVEGLMRFKFKHAEITGKSILNAFNYLLSPQDNCTILSDNHRRMVSENLLKKEYSPSRFIRELIEYFDRYNIKLQNPVNFTYLISSLVYSLKSEWVDEVIGLMASDGTGWQEDATLLEDEYEGLIIGNSKKPSGSKKTLKFLEDRIKDGQTFPLYYTSKGYVRYKANIVDFAIDQNSLTEKKWSDKKIKGYESNFEDYKDDRKKASILFLAESIEKISPKPISDFKFYKNFVKPTQDNLSPIKEIENDIEVIKPEISMTKNPNSALNQILFGPPGTGKTYQTINQALQIIGTDISGLTRTKIKDIFNEKVKEGQIVFTTFHQSMSYEEFIEGIKPIEPEKEGDEVIYRVEPGLFKKLSIEASFDIARSSKSKETTENNSYLNDLNRELIDTYQCIRDDVESVIEELKQFKNDEKFYYQVRSKKFRKEHKKAARFIYLNQTSFNGIYRVNLNGEYNVPFGYRKKNFLEPENLRIVSDTLINASFSKENFSKTLENIRERDLVFLDPPYTITHNNNGFFKYNQKLFSEKNQYELSEMIDEIKNKGAYYILTNAAHSKVKEIFDKGDLVFELSRSSLVGGTNAIRGNYSEYMFTNIQKLGTTKQSNQAI